MKTVPTLVASGSGVAVSALGLLLARQESQPDARLTSRAQSSSLRRIDSAPLFDMTSTATCTVQAFETYATPRSFHFSSPTSYSPSARQSLHSVGSRENTPSHARRDSSEKSGTLKRSLHSREGGHGHIHMASDLGKNGEDASEVSGWGTSVTQAAWKRLSTFSSNDSSMPSSPRPSSAAVSHSNNSVAFSNTGSTAPMFPSHTPPTNPPNKLVKRTSSVRSTRSNSRLPIPSLKRPATSHQREASLQEQARLSSYTENTTDQADLKWTTYFTPKVAADKVGSTLRRHSTGIPNPIKRVYPDRKYHPVLLSASQAVLVPASIEVDEELDQGLSFEDGSRRRPSTTYRMSRRIFSTPLPQRVPMSESSLTTDLNRQLEHDSVHESLPRISTSTRSGNYDKPFFSSPVLPSHRSFSPVLPETAELPKWKRPQKPRLLQGKQRRKAERSVSGPELSMGNTQGAIGGRTERPPKRRDIIGLVSSRQSLDKTRKEPSLPHQVAAATPPHEVELNLPELAPRIATLQALNPRSFSEQQTYRSENSIPFPEAHLTSSPTAESDASRPSRQSASLSEFASTFGGSDYDARLAEEDGFDSSDGHAYDSVRTRATSAGSVFKVPAIENFFDEPIPSATTGHDHSYQKSPFTRDVFDKPRHSVIEEEESVSTPVRSQYGGSVMASSDTFRFVGSSPIDALSSSPPPMPSVYQPTGLTRPLDDFRENDDSWSFSDEDDEPSSQLPLKKRFPHLDLDSNRLSPFTKSQGSSSVTTTPSKGGIMSINDKDARSSIFDWSEQQPLDKSPANGSPPRPRTVHGKKDAENRGSRAIGRRAPSTTHVRSQSVPVVPETESKRSGVVTNKFGTWGVGSKGVTEDWNEDFDFEEIPALPNNAQAVIEEKRLDSGLSMFVPSSIREQQTNVLANIGMLRDWGLLIEELKELRLRAAQLRLLHEKMDMWYEVDAMVDLADQESNDHTLAPRQSPPSSPSFDYEAFDEPLPARRPSPMPNRLSLVVEDVFESPSVSPARRPDDQTNTPRRPRKDSEAVARSVIEALQSKRNVSDPTHAKEPAQKVPFDTATLRRIVPYVQELRDKVKKVIREKEGLYTSPLHREPLEDPSFSRIFRDLPDSPSGRRRSRRSTAATDHVMSEEGSSRSPPDDLTTRLSLMTVV